MTEWHFMPFSTVYFSHIKATAHIIHVFPGGSPVLGWALNQPLQHNPDFKQPTEESLLKT